jgi:hypothetical protein
MDHFERRPDLGPMRRLPPPRPTIPVGGRPTPVPGGYEYRGRTIKRERRAAWTRKRVGRKGAMGMSYSTRFVVEGAGEYGFALLRDAVAWIDRAETSAENVTPV